mmetsp:Transcript_17543/g.25968  ORF Transcript_17543/g.25968 Transcript_17543/m.25968 type:complete len:255 (+) Transcript_17543:168-932(+)
MTTYLISFCVLITLTEPFVPSRPKSFVWLKSKIDESDESLFQEIFDSGGAIRGDLPFDDPIPSDDKIDEMLDKILANSIDKVESTLPEESQGVGLNLMEDEEFKKEIAGIFDKASVDLKSAFDEIRSDQEDFANETSEKSAARVESAIKEEQARLERAQASMSKIIDKVNKETAEVEKAVQELKEAQMSSSNDALTTLANGGVIKQGALAGTILFTVRSALETFYVLCGDSSHAIPALIQGALALILAAYLFFA